jgi:hypothetical protein
VGRGRWGCRFPVGSSVFAQFPPWLWACIMWQQLVIIHYRFMKLCWYFDFACNKGRNTRTGLPHMRTSHWYPQNPWGVGGGCSVFCPS